MLYPKNALPFDTDLFKNPTSEYRGAPFWAWNCALDPDELKCQIDCLQTMGFGGFHMHVRTGMATPYLSDAYMDLIRTCIAKAKANHMLAWLYDEDRWPSGAAGGLVTQNIAWRARHLLLTPMPYEQDGGGSEATDSSARASRTGNGRLLARYDIVLDDQGCLASGKRLAEGETARGTCWYAYLETAKPNPWYNNQTYVDTLNPRAIQAFIAATHERYRETCRDEFGAAVPAIFTDEPQFSHKTLLAHAADQTDVVLPWTDDLPASFAAATGADLLERVPELVWNLPDGQVSLARYRYHDHIAERFAAAFADQIGTWCQQNDLLLTGHMMEEPTLKSQTAALGEAMRSYRSFGLPGIDILCDRREWTTAKQAQSASRQFGCPGVLSELYGVTNWDFDLRGHKLQGDWQAALGVTVRVPHLSWVSMAGEAKRDYPASINYQVPWHTEYPLVEDHFARVNTALTRGRAVCHVGVIHPVESYWLHWGPEEQTASVRASLDEHFAQLTDHLVRGQIDFDFISESLLPELCPQGSCPLEVGRMAYDTIVVPDLVMLRRTTISRLEQFADAGGRVIFLCACPTRVDGQVSDAAKRLYARAEKVRLTRLDVLEALEPSRQVAIRARDGRLSDRYLCQLREDGAERWLFVAHADHPANQDLSGVETISVKIRGDWDIALCDTQNGAVGRLEAKRRAGWTELETALGDHDSLLLRLLPPGAGLSLPAAVLAGPRPDLPFVPLDLTCPAVPIRRSEPNVCLLDMASFALDDAPLRPAEELLRADNLLRAELGWPLRQKAVAQPWTVPDQPAEHRVRLRFDVACTARLDGCQLALEMAGQARIRLNGQPVSAIVTGWYVDKAIQTVALPALEAGENQIDVELPFGRRTDLEWCYLLGDFSVQVSGTRRVLGPAADILAFSDITRQGLPFYGGNITYLTRIETGKAPAWLHLPQYRGALVTVAVDSARVGPVVYSPYTLKLPDLAPGVHELAITLFGNRVNTFGPVHNADRKMTWFGPNAWRTSGDAWSYSYQLKETGLIKAPELAGAAWI